MAAKKGAKKGGKRTAKKATSKRGASKRGAKGQHFATLGKKVPDGYFAFVKGNEVRITKRNTKGRPKGSKNKRQGCKR